MNNGATFNQSKHLQMKQNDAIDVDPVDISIGRCTNNQGAIRWHRQTVDGRFEAHMFIVGYISFIFN